MSATTTSTLYVTAPAGSQWGSDRPYRGNSEVTYLWDTEGGGTFYRHMRDYPEGGIAIVIANEAYAEQRDRDHSVALLEQNYRLAHPTMTPGERDEQAAQAQAEALGASAAQRAKLRTIVTERRDALAALAVVNARVRELETEQIGGADPRLASFWQRAMDNAEIENYCAEYDRMAELLGGPRRSRPGHVHVTVTVNVSVDVDDIDDYSIDADDIAAALENADSSDYNWETDSICAD